VWAVGGAELMGEGLTEAIEGGGGIGLGAGLFMPEGADDDGIGRKDDRGLEEPAEGAVNPAIKVGLGAAFEFEQAAGHVIDAGAKGKVLATIEVPIAVLLKKNGSFLQPHDLCPSSFMSLKIRMNEQ